MTRAELIDEMATVGPLSHKQADVVVTNPTHVAVALRYRAGETAAPTA